MEFLKLSSAAQLSLCMLGEKGSKSFMNYSRNLEALQRTSRDTAALAPTLCSSHRLKESIVKGPVAGATGDYFLRTDPINASVGAKEQSSPCSFSFAMLSLSILISLDTWIREKSQVLQAINCFVPVHKRDAHMENPGL